MVCNVLLSKYVTMYIKAYIAYIQKWKVMAKVMLVATVVIVIVVVVQTYTEDADITVTCQIIMAVL